MSNSTQQSGFTIVELLVTIIVAALFISVFYNMFLILVGINSNARNVAQASDLAYANMRRYPTAATVTGTGITCASPGGSGNLLSTTGTDSNYPELGTVTETVTASYPYGCTAVYDVIKLVSVVTYGSNSTKVSYATYVN